MPLMSLPSPGLAATLALACLLAMVVPAGAAPPAGAGKPPAVADLAWIAGHWEGTLGKARIEEVWSAPGGGAMMGMFRWLDGERVIVYEFLTIEAAPDGSTVLKLRHFAPGLIAREEKESPGTFHLVGWKEGEVTFDNRDPSHSIQLTYRRTGADGLTAVLVRTKDGKTETEDFVYKRRR